MEAVVEVAGPHEEWIRPEAATAAQISAVHTGDHLERVRREGVSAGFDDHEEDWGGTLRTRDYREIGRRVLESAVRRGEVASPSWKGAIIIAS